MPQASKNEDQELCSFKKIWLYLHFVACTDIRIVGGILAELNEFPWMAALVYEESNGEQKIACGGSLISSNVIMTAAHCIPSINDILSNYELTKIKIGAR